MKLPRIAALAIALAVPCFCCAQQKAQSRSESQQAQASQQGARMQEASQRNPLSQSAQQERPGVPQGAPPATFSITRHGKIIFEADVREPDSSRVALTETVEISGIKAKEGWTDFISAFVNATSQEWLSLIAPSAAAKKGKVTIAFALRHDGSLEGVLSIPKSSGDAAIDDATRLAIAKSAPFHELPSSFHGAVAQFRVTFAYNHPHPLAPAAAGGDGGTP